MTVTSKIQVCYCCVVQNGSAERQSRESFCTSSYGTLSEWGRKPCRGVSHNRLCDQEAHERRRRCPPIGAVVKRLLWNVIACGIPFEGLLRNYRLPFERQLRDAIRETTVFRPLSARSRQGPSSLLSVVSSTVSNTSTSTALTTVSQSVLEDLNHGKPDLRSLVAAIGISKAFDTVPWYKLISKILDTQLQYNYKRWLSNFIAGRQDRISYGGVMSKHWQLPNWVPQEAVLSPSLFSLFTHD